MDKSPKTRTELEALVLAELRAATQCGGASHVTVVPYDDYRVPATWEVASFNPSQPLLARVPIYFPTTFRSASLILSCQPGPAS